MGVPSRVISAVVLLARSAALHDAALRESGLEVLFVSDLIEKTGRPAADFYFEDGTHTTPECNRLIAQAIREHLGLTAK